MRANYNVEYSCSDLDNCFYSGIKFQDFFIQEYLSERIHQRYFDTEGSEELTNEFSDIETTDFEIEELRKIFEIDIPIDDWRIGEVLAECFLEDYKEAKFYYNHIRDAKNPRSSLTGTDLVGFVNTNNQTIFLFGEVKSSHQQVSPPSVIYGDTGLISQLNDLKGNSKVRGELIRWLGLKVFQLPDSHPFKIDFKKALYIYYNSENKRIKIVGVLIRDTEPNEDDLKRVFDDLKYDLDSDTLIELLALYLPMTFIDAEIHFRSA